MQPRMRCYTTLLGLFLFSAPAFAEEKPILGVQGFVIPAEDMASTKREALAGSGAAAYRLAQHYGFVALDTAEQLYWMTIAAENGHTNGIYGLGLLLSRKGDETSRLRARYWLEKSRDRAEEPAASLARQVLQRLDNSQ